MNSICHAPFIILLSLFFSLELFCQSINVVRVKEYEDKFEITNGLLGLVIPTENAFRVHEPAPAPIQSFIYRNGEHSDDTKNALQSPTPALSLKIEFVVKRADKLVVKIEYKFLKKEFLYGKQRFAGGEAGPGFYVCTITIEKNKKTILIEEDSNYDVSYSVKISKGLYPDKARYRGWLSTGVEFGYEVPGKIYRPELERGAPSDATLDINYEKLTKHPRLVLWEPAGGERNSGRYWMLFNGNASSDANLFGFFQGPPNRLIGARGIGVQLQTLERKKDSQRGDAELSMSIERRGADNSWYPRKRFQWAVFISSKTDLLSPEMQQPIATEMNRISGLGNVITGYASRPAKIIPSFYQGSIYMPAAEIKNICQRIKSNLQLYNMLCSVDPGYKKIWDAWRFSDSAKALKQFLINVADQLKLEYINGNGSYSIEHRYWMGSNLFKYYALLTSSLFADQSLQISTAEKRKLEQFIAMMARIVWDDNNVPLFDSAGVNMGPANMAFMYRNNGRFFFAMLLAHDPEFRERASKVVKAVELDIDNAIYKNGSSFGTPHYIQPTIDPILFSMLQLKNTGLADLFKTQEKVSSFARFYTMLLTPQSVRFMKNRKLISFGDGSEESAVTFALLSAGLKDINPSLSKTLLSAYYYGPKKGTTFGSVGLAVNLEYPLNPGSIDITSSNYTGYVSHFRSAVNTDNESALWALNGNGLYDHRNDDAGEVAIYALQAPLSLSRSSFYYPSATDSRIRSVVVPEKDFPEWNQKQQPITGRSLTNRLWQLSDVESFANLGKSATALIKMQSKTGGKVWYRRISTINLYDKLPIYIFYDSVTGNEKNIWSMPMMAERTVIAPQGLVTPEERLHNNNDFMQLPGATQEYRLSTGLNEFTFTGQSWNAHATGGINWKMITASSVATNFTLSSWTTTWQNSIEVGEFFKTNQRKYSEEQQIIRLQSSKPFFNLILPFSKNDTSYHNSKFQSLSSHMIALRQQQYNVVITPSFYYAEGKNNFTAALFTREAVLTTNGYKLSGGCMELEVKGNSVLLRLHGGSGTRILTLPFLLKTSKKTKTLFKSLEQESGRTILRIDYTQDSLDLPNGVVGYKEIQFEKL
ncbi:MAG: hypothetical protein ACTHMM_06250 [Agriterribacter sp.]